MCDKEQDLPIDLNDKEQNVAKEKELSQKSQKRKEIHKSYTVTFKLEAVAFAAANSKEAAARKYNVAPKWIREWVKQKDQLKDLLEKPGGGKRKKLEGAGRKPMSEDLEDNLFDWILDMRDKRARVSRNMVKNKAKEMYRQDPDVSLEMEVRGSEFLASNGWLNRFLRRYNLTLRRKTTQGQ